MELRLAEVLATLSLATDLGTAFPLEKALRNAVLAVGLGREAGLSRDELSDAYYVAMLRFLGCSAYAHELAAAFGGDDNAFHSTFEPVDIRRPDELLGTAARQLARDGSLVTRVASVARFAVAGSRIAQQMRVADCEAADVLARRLWLSDGVRNALAHVWTHWDGSGMPAVAGDDIAIAARCSLIANLVEIFHRLNGRAAALEMLRRRRGTDLDPSLVDCFIAHADDSFSRIESDSAWDAALAAEPEPWQRLADSDLDAIAQAFGDFTDLKSPYTLGHSSGVARLAEAATRLLGATGADVTACRRAALVQDIGRISVPNGIWDKRGRLSAVEWERVRMHAYFTERILAQSSVWRPIAVLASMHHERADGSGYHRACGASAQPLFARVLAAADAFQAMQEERPYREARAPAAAVEELEREAQQGRLDAEAVHAVLRAAGYARARAQRTWPAGLSDREVQVLRLVARGKSDKEIGRALVISEITVHHHVRHIYNKIGMSSRAGAALFAMEHDLVLPADE